MSLLCVIAVSDLGSRGRKRTVSDVRGAKQNNERRAAPRRAMEVGDVALAWNRCVGVLLRLGVVRRVVTQTSN